MTRLYDDLATWWPLFSPPSEYVEEAADLLRILDARVDASHRRLLELGCGGGSLASHLAARFDLTLVDRSPAMVAVCRATIPAARVLTGDMREVRLGERFDVVLVHDAIMYALTEADLRAAIATAAAHCAPGGVAVFLPDCVAETFQPGIETGGHDDGVRGLRFIEWIFDPDPDDNVFEAHFAILLRDESGRVRVEHDTHRFGVFPEAVWRDALEGSGFSCEARTDPWRARVFVGRRR